MRRWPILVNIVAAVLLLGTVAGCGESPDLKTPVRPNPPPPIIRTAWEAERGGVIRGQVIYDGEPPAMEFLVKMKDHVNAPGCLMGGPSETHRQTWVVNEQNKGVANVVVWLEPPD